MGQELAVVLTDCEEFRQTGYLLQSNVSGTSGLGQSSVHLQDVGLFHVGEGEEGAV